MVENKSVKFNDFISWFNSHELLVVKDNGLKKYNNKFCKDFNYHPSSSSKCKIEVSDSAIICWFIDNDCSVSKKGMGESIAISIIIEIFFHVVIDKKPLTWKDIAQKYDQNNITMEVALDELYGWNKKVRVKDIINVMNDFNIKSCKSFYGYDEEKTIDLFDPKTFNYRKFTVSRKYTPNSYIRLNILRKFLSHTPPLYIKVDGVYNSLQGTDFIKLVKKKLIDNQSIDISLDLLLDQGIALFSDYSVENKSCREF